MPTKSFPKLQAAIKGVLYPSDSDEPFEILAADDSDSSEAAVRRLLDLGNKLPHHERPVEEFFAELEPDKGFQKLHKVLQEELSDVKVHCFGDVKITVAIAGMAKNGNLVVLKTTSIET